MLFGNKNKTKPAYIRIQNWSAPSIMTVFIIMCMIVVYSFETIGLFRKETNLEHRTLYFDNGKFYFC